MDIKPPDEGLEAAANKDSNAGKESKDYARLDELDGAKHKIRLYIHNVLSILVPASITFFFLLYWAGVFIYAIHMVSEGWLPEAKLHELRAALFSGFIGAVISQGIKRYLD